ncbi:MAG: hypothetical protein JWQ71_4875 [Pedosphaera sp.]|nr:hypothetical protein [Pedosphaera sp.]
MKTGNGHGETDRVRAHTLPSVNEHIDEKTKQQLVYYVSRPEGISQRIQELDSEWDVERWLETNASSLALGGLLLGLTFNKKWLWVPGIVLPFLLMHAVQGWCPPLPLLRRLGVRTQREIDEEKYALKYLRGDFQEIKAAIEETRRAITAYKASAL